MKLSDDTFLRRIIENTIKEWQKKVPDVKLEDYADWQEEIIQKVVEFIDKKQNPKEEENEDTKNNSS